MRSRKEQRPLRLIHAKDARIVVPFRDEQMPGVQRKACQLFPRRIPQAKALAQQHGDLPLRRSSQLDVGFLPRKKTRQGSAKSVGIKDAAFRARPAVLP